MTFETNDSESAKPLNRSKAETAQSQEPINERSTEIVQLLKRCQSDLNALEQVLAQIESAIRIELGQDSVQHAKIEQSHPVNRPHALANVPELLAGDAIRRVAQDIENLCRLPATSEIDEMLNTLQSRMVRCLKLLPSGI